MTELGTEGTPSLKVIGALVALASVLSAAGARALPTPTSGDRALDRLETQQQIRDLRDEQFRADIRREIAALREQVGAVQGEGTNRLVSLTARLERLERRK